MPSGRPKIEIPEDEIREALSRTSTKKDAASILGISSPTLNRLMQDLGIDTRANFVTEKIESSEDMSLEDLVDKYSEEPIVIGQGQVDIELDDKDVLIVLMSDLHVGSNTTDIQRIYDDVEIIRDTPHVFVGFCGDYTDNFNKRGHGGGIYDQVMSVSDQRTFVKKMFEELKEKTLWVVQGCHDEWSYNDDGFDASKYYAKHVKGYWLGFGGVVDITFSTGISYRIYATHRPPSASRLNRTLGLQKICDKGIDFDVGVSAHYHVPDIGITKIRGRERTMICCGTYKKPNRYPLHKNMSYGRQDAVPIPGVLLRCREKLAIPFMDYTRGLEYI